MSQPASLPALRVAFQQTSLPAYRLPVFKRLAARAGREFMLHYGSEEPALKNVEPDGFAGRFEPFVSLPRLAGQQFFWHQTQWRLASRQQADVAVMCWNSRYLSLLPALLRARFNRVPVALWGHGFSKRQSRLRSFLRLLPARLAQAVVVYDFKTARQLAAGGVPAEKVFVAPNGLDSERIQAARTKALAEHNRDEWRQIKQLGDGPVLVFLGRLFEENRLDVVIDALPELAKDFPGIRLVIIGNGEAVRDRLQARASQLGVQHLLVWVGPVYQEDALAPWMVAADVFVYPSNVGLSLIHAFNYGLPAVACEPVSAHNPEIVALADGENGLLAESLQPADFATSVGSLLADESRRLRMGEAALACVQQTYNEQRMVDGFDQLIAYLDSQR